MASPSDSITVAIRKFPLNFTRLAFSGSSDTMKERWPSTSSNGWILAKSSCLPAATMKSLPAAAASGRPNTGAAI
jgi:hypothetical protein